MKTKDISSLSIKQQMRRTKTKSTKADIGEKLKYLVTVMENRVKGF